MTVAAQPDELLVADSFRVRVAESIAEVRGLQHHLQRFSEAAAEVAYELAADAAASSAEASSAAARQWVAEALPREIDRAREEIASYGAGFPRLELRRVYGNDHVNQLARIRLVPRPLPMLSDTIALRTAPRLELSHPDRKGPNIARLSALNRSLGGEALLVNAAGLVLEGATTSVLWWQDTTLCTVESDARVPSVTERLVRDIAGRAGISVVKRMALPHTLARHEVWAVNALHGIRVVTHLDDVPVPPPASSRLRQFRSALNRTWEPVHQG